MSEKKEIRPTEFSIRLNIPNLEDGDRFQTRKTLAIFYDTPRGPEPVCDKCVNGNSGGEFLRIMRQRDDEEGKIKRQLGLK